MTRTKKTALLISALAIVLCAAVIVGATFALFTDNEEYSIGVNTGKIDVSGTLTLTEAWSEAQTSGDKKTVTPSASGDENNRVYTATVEQGGTVKIEHGNTITFNLMSLGDGAKMSLSFDNNSTVRMQYRIIISVVTGTETPSEFLRDNLTIKVGEGAATTMFSEENTSYAIVDWTTVEATAETNGIAAVTFEIALPWSALEASESLTEEQSISLKVSMEAIQGNADTGAMSGVVDGD